MTPPGIPLKPNLVLFLTRTLILLIAVTNEENIGAFTSVLSEFSADCEGKGKYICFDMQAAAGARAALATARQTKGFLL